jgi:hypothetical protein
MPDKLRVYISFAQEDRQRVRQLESAVRAEGFGTWFDEKDLPPASNWEDVIERAIPDCDVFVCCVSTRSVSRPGFYDQEITLALNLRRDGFVIPVRLDETELPPALRKLLPVDLFRGDGIPVLLHDLHARARLRRPVRPVAPVAPAAVHAAKPVRILHLSDLHFEENDDHRQLLNILDEDLQGKIDFLVVSGDLSNRCNEGGFQSAAEFLSELQTRRKIPPERCILVPGNHDVQRDLDSFDLRQQINKNRDDAVKVLAGDLDTPLYLVRKTNSYADRFTRYATVHKQFTGRDYDLADPSKQVCVVVSDEHRIQFLGLNSAWEIDQFRPKRASIHSDALDSGLRALRARPDYLGIAVWHHAITGNDKIQNDAFLGRLSKAGVRLCLHGDVHELRPDVVSPYGPSRIHVMGTGSFGAGARDRPESTPRLYNLIEVYDDRKRASVSTRQQAKSGAPFDAYATWSIPGQRDHRSGRYEFTIDPPDPSHAAANVT